MTDKREIVVVGAGGHAKVVVSAIQALGSTVTGLYDDDEQVSGACILGVPVVGKTGTLKAHGSQAAVIGIGDNDARRLLVSSLGNLTWVSIVHPHACVHPSVKIGKGTVIFAGAIVQPDVTIGDHCIINSGAIIEHDSNLGDFVHVAPGVKVAGNVRIGSGALLGVGSVVLPGLIIGDAAKVGGGAVVVGNIEPNATAAGVPARPLG